MQKIIENRLAFVPHWLLMTILIGTAVLILIAILVPPYFLKNFL